MKLIDFRLFGRFSSFPYNFSSVFHSSVVLCIFLIDYSTQVTEADVLPKHICARCLEKISDFHEFYRDVLAAQCKFMENLVNGEPEPSKVAAVPITFVVDESSDDGSFDYSNDEIGDSETLDEPVDPFFIKEEDLEIDGEYSGCLNF